jgi:hypothetical protein
MTPEEAEVWSCVFRAAFIEGGDARKRAGFTADSAVIQMREHFREQVEAEEEAVRREAAEVAAELPFQRTSKKKAAGKPAPGVAAPIAVTPEGETSAEDFLTG